MKGDGSTNQRKLSDAQVIGARGLRMTGGIGWERLGRHYGVSSSAMRCACLGYTYRRVKDGLSELKAFEAQVRER